MKIAYDEGMQSSGKHVIVKTSTSKYLFCGEVRYCISLKDGWSTGFYVKMGDGCSFGPLQKEDQIEQATLVNPWPVTD